GGSRSVAEPARAHRRECSGWTVATRRPVVAGRLGPGRHGRGGCGAGWGAVDPRAPDGVAAVWPYPSAAVGGVSEHAGGESGWPPPPHRPCEGDGGGGAGVAAAAPGPVV